MYNGVCGVVVPEEIICAGNKRINTRIDVEDALKDKLILTLETWEEETSMYRDYCVFEVLCGEVDDTIVSVEGSRVKHVLVPKTVPTIVLYKCYDDSVEPAYEYNVIYIFTVNGWRKISLQDGETD